MSRYAPPATGNLALDIGNIAPEIDLTLDEFLAGVTPDERNERLIQKLRDPDYDFFQLYSEHPPEKCHRHLISTFKDRVQELAVDVLFQLHEEHGRFSETTEQHREYLLYILGAGEPTPKLNENQSNVAWRYGDARRLGLIYRLGEFSNAGFFQTPMQILNFAIQAVLKNLIRRYNAEEHPVVHQVFNAFSGYAKPTLIPFEVVYESKKFKKILTFNEARALASQSPTDWKPIILQMKNEVEKNDATDPDLKVLMNAVTYRMLDDFLGGPVEDDEIERPRSTPEDSLAISDEKRIGQH